MLKRVLFVCVVLAAACDDAPKAERGPSRFNGVKRAQGDAAQKSFCEVSFPGSAGGEGARAFTSPAEKPIPGGPAAKKAGGGWKWINLWATWCHPCIEEIGLLGKWQTSLAKDGVPIDLELYSVDDDEAALTGWLKKTNMPGTVRWLKGGANDLPAVLESFGVDKTAGVPVHALVDGNGKLRCVRTGSVHDEDYGAIKAILLGG
jgi:thiol-disulfide isomerase/thioredoxin